MKAVRYDAACCRAAPRSHWNVMLSRPVDKIPDDQKIIDIAHILNDIQLIVKLFLDCTIILRIALL